MLKDNLCPLRLACRHDIVCLLNQGYGKVKLVMLQLTSVSNHEGKTWSRHAHLFLLFLSTFFLSSRPLFLRSHGFMRKGKALFWSISGLIFVGPTTLNLKSPRLWKLKSPWEWQMHGRHDATRETYLFWISGPSVFILLHKRLNRLPLLLALVFYWAEITKALSIIEK